MAAGDAHVEPAGRQATGHLFQLGNFTLASGQRSPWKIECDALTNDDWRGLARIAAELFARLHVPFGEVVGVPTGGTLFAQALDPYVTEGAPTLLVVDDVWTTGGSMKRWAARNYPNRHWVGCVAFARRTPDYFIKPLFLMHQQLLDQEPAASHPSPPSPCIPNTTGDGNG